MNIFASACAAIYVAARSTRAVCSHAIFTPAASAINCFTGMSSYGQVNPLPLVVASCHDVLQWLWEWHTLSCTSYFLM